MEFFWPIGLIVLIGNFIYFINDILLIILKIKKSNHFKAKEVTEIFKNKFNKNVIFFESPLVENGFGVNVSTKEKMGIVISQKLLWILSTEDLIEIVKNISNLHEKKGRLFILMNKLWTLLFISPYALISFPSIFISKRLYIVEKFFALPVYFFSQLFSQNIIKYSHRRLPKMITFKRNSMLDKIDDCFLGPHLLFYLNSTYYKSIRDRYFES